MIQLNLLLKFSAIIAGNFDGKKITRTKFQHFINLLAICLMIFEFLKVIALTINQDFKFWLSVFYFTDYDSIQIIWTFFTGLVHLGFARNYIMFYKFNPNGEKIRFLNYLLCKDKKELKSNYKFGTIVVKKSAKMIKLKEFGILPIIYYLLPVLYIIVIQLHTARSIYLAYLNSQKNDGISMFGFSISILTSLTLDIVYVFESLSVCSFYLIFIANCKFLAYRIEDLNRKLAIQLKLNRIDGYDSKSKRQIDKITTEINSILKFHNSNQKLSNISLASYYICVLLIALFFPYMMLFERKNLFYQIVLIIIYSIEMSCRSYPIIWANTLVSEKFKEYRNIKLTFLRYSNDTRTKIKLLYYGEKSNEDELDFNCFGLFKYKNEFLSNWIIETISNTLMIYSAINM